MPIRSAALGLLLVTTPCWAAEPSWQQRRDEFLGSSRTLLDQQCQRAQQANAEGISAFNDRWVQRTQDLRFKAGVDRLHDSRAFFAGLSAAMQQVCPPAW